MSKNWRLIVKDLGNGLSTFDRFCTSADNAKTWAKGVWRGCLSMYPNGLEFKILDPIGNVYCVSNVTAQSNPRRMKWEQKGN